MKRNTRASKRIAEENGEGESSAKRGRTGGQLSIEESMGHASDQKNEENGGVAMGGVGGAIEDDEVVSEQIREDPRGVKAPDEAAKQSDNHGTKNGHNGHKNDEKNAFDEVRADTEEVKSLAQKEQDSKTKDISKNNKSVIKDEQREAAIPPSILEKGIIYFFFRGKVGTADPEGIKDVARSYIVLRPLPLGPKLGHGPLPDVGNARLLALPKKIFPKSKQDRFLMFVEKPKAHIKDLRESFASNDYATKTSGTSHTPAATPFAEGVYSITSTGRKSHLVYHITYPKIGEIQEALGVHEKGSYVMSVKNPQNSGLSNVGLSDPAKYPDHIQKKFRELKWMPLEPELLDYESTQVLIIGEGMGSFGGAMQDQSKDKKDDSKERPDEELERLEDEDHDRVENLKEDDPIFADLGLSSKEYSKMRTSW